MSRTVSQTINLLAPDQTEKYISRIDQNGITVHPENQVQDSNYIHIDGSGFKIKNQTGAEPNINIDTVLALFGTETIIKTLDGTELAHFGYDEGQSQSGMVIAPYYTFGQRMTDSVVGIYSMAEGYETIASGPWSHAEGMGTIASGPWSHVEGYEATASGSRSHAEGSSKAEGEYSHAEGSETVASGQYSHAQNYNTIARGQYQTVIGKYNIATSIASDHAFIIGNGTSDSARSNALTVDWNGQITRGDGASYTAVQITRW